MTPFQEPDELEPDDELADDDSDEDVSWSE
jgi:hypothetical protein